MAEPKTRPTGASVTAFLDAVPDPTRRADAKAVLKLMKRISGLKAEMWGPAIIGFGRQDLAYASGRKVAWPRIAFSPRKGSLVLYLTLDGYDAYRAILARLGKHETSRSCLSIRKLADVDLAVLAELIEASLAPPRPRRA